MRGPYIADESEGVELMRALLHAKVVFQLRAISAALGLNPAHHELSQHPDTHGRTFSVGAHTFHASGDSNA